MSKAKTKKSSEAARIADQLHRAFYGEAWHGPCLKELVEDIDAETAAARPVADAHSIWELLLHVAVWDRVALTRLDGKKSQPKGLANFPLSPKPTGAAWRKAIADTFRTHDTLTRIVAKLSDQRLLDRVPGKRYDFYHMLHGMVQHELYHGGQIAILKKAHTIKT
ncbi:MAG TPA: DinB family protein [Candidatus Sulfotelmatobacter sp.]|nr:DinB family protein [Candidatus Sulfotelmatobacter sp.]